jgi:hypothetical protein
VIRWVPAAAGLTGVVASVVAADVIAARTDRPTISAAVARTLEHPVGAPLVIGALAALGWHLAADPIIRRLEAAR